MANQSKRKSGLTIFDPDRPKDFGKDARLLLKSIRGGWATSRTKRKKITRAAMNALKILEDSQSDKRSQEYLVQVVQCLVEMDGVNLEREGVVIGPENATGVGL